MLEDLHVKDVALVREAYLELGPGLTVLTGETGAGKTALLSALKLLVGERATSIMVREGARDLFVEGRFFEDDGASGVEKGTELLVKRRVSSDGRSKCSIDDEMATVGSLSQRVGPLLDLHGQHEHQALLDTSTHVSYLDRWIGPAALSAKETYLCAREAYRESLVCLAEVEGAIERAEEEYEAHRIAVAEIEAVAPVEGEHAELLARLPMLQHSERLTTSADAAFSALRGEDAAIDMLATVRTTLQDAIALDPRLSSLSTRLDSSIAELEDIAGEVRAYRDAIEADPQELQITLERLAALDGLTKRFGPRIEDVFAKLESARRALEITEDSEGALARSREECEAARSAFAAAADELADVRLAHAEEFAAEVDRVIADLEMEGACVQVSLAPLDFERWTVDGPQNVEFLYSPAPSVKPRSLAKIASGGEISRVMLALKTVLSAADRTPTLVFDEIDAGVGGAVATKVGKTLKQIATHHQVIVVTHLAQVAAFADDHFLVERVSDADDTIETVVRHLEADERVGEVARMLSGTAHGVAFDHAKELIRESQEDS